MSHSKALLTAVFIICWLAGIEAIVALGWAAQLRTIKFASVISYCLVCAAFLLRARDTAQRSSNLPVLTATALILVSFAIAICTDDFSYDGQDYQRDAIHSLVSGWNPFVSPHSNGASTLWVSHYAKGPWIVGASLASLTGNYEIGKSQNFLLLASASLLVYHATRNIRRMSRTRSTVIAVLVALNPVNSYQLFTGFVDSQMGSLVVILALLLYCYVLETNWVLEVAAVASAVLLINTKLSAGLFVLVLFSVFMLFLIGSRKIDRASGVLRAGSFGVALGLLVGYNPFVTNYIDHGHPFYPLAGSGSINIIKGFVTDEFLNKNRIEKFVLSLTSESHHDYGADLQSASEQIRLKLPFAVSKSELATFYRSSGPFIGGFGFWTSGALLLLAVAGALRLENMWRTETNTVDGAAMTLLCALLLSVLTFPESWWARYVPHFWAFVVLATGFLFEERPRNIKLLGYATAAVLAINSTIIFMAAGAHQVVQQLDYIAQMRSLKNIGAVKPIEVKVKFQSSAYRMRELGISFVQRDVLSCAQQAEIIGGGATFCIDESLRPLYTKGSPLVAALLRR